MRFKLTIIVLSLGSLFLTDISFAISRSEKNAFNRKLRAEINQKVPSQARRRYPGLFTPNVFLYTNFQGMPYFKKNGRILFSIQQLQKKYRLQLQSLENRQVSKSRRKSKHNNIISLNNFKLKFPKIKAKAGMDYFYFDPGKLMPENEKVSIKTYPFYYYDCKVGIDLNVLGIDFRLKNSLLDNKMRGNNLNEEYKNKEDTLDKEEKAKTKEKVMNLVGYLTPFKLKLGKEYLVGLYGKGEYRLFQTEVQIEEPITFLDKTKSITLSPEDINLINIFQESYTLGVAFSRGHFKFAFGYKYWRTDAPHYIEDDNQIETVSSKTHSVYAYVDTSGFWNMRTTCESTYGITRFIRPNGERVHYILTQEVSGETHTLVDTDTFYRSSVKNKYQFTFYNHITIGFYLGFSGIIPLYRESVPGISLSLLAQGWLYHQAITKGGAPMFQAPVELLFNYYLFKKMYGDVFYSEILAGAKAGIKI